MMLMKSKMIWFGLCAASLLTTSCSSNLKANAEQGQLRVIETTAVWDSVAMDTSVLEESSMNDSVQDSKTDNSAETILTEEAITKQLESTVTSSVQPVVLSEEVDIDLTNMSSTLILAEVYNIVIDPEAYVGKSIKVNGIYSPAYFEETSQYYHFVVIEDAAACCQQGLEFIWNGEHAYPDDYPKEGAEIEFIGVYKTYEELGNTYFYLSVEDWLIR